MRERERERKRKEEGSCRKQTFAANIWEYSLKLEDCQRHNLHNPFITTHPTNIVEINNPLESNQSPKEPKDAVIHQPCPPPALIFPYQSCPNSPRISVPGYQSPISFLQSIPTKEHQLTKLIVLKYY